MDRDGNKALYLPTLQEEFFASLKRSSGSVPRRYEFPEGKNQIKVAIGMRRSGKTYFLFQTIRNLLASGVPKEKILYLNLEDDRLLPMDQKTLGSMIDAWYTLDPSRHRHCCYLFLDEIQNIDGWPLVLRRILDTKEIQIYITGSSAKLLAKEIASSLRGRSLAIEILPFNYLEYLDAHQYEAPSKSMGRSALDHQRSYLLEYFQTGGFPGIQFIPPNEQLETLQNYVETVIFRDIIERYQIVNVNLLKYFILSLLKNTSSLFSIHKFVNDVKSQGYKLGKDTLYNYLTYIEDAFLVFTVPLFTESLRQSQITAKKIYAIDPGLAGANTFHLSEDLGKCFENMIYLDLRRQGKKVFYYRTAEGHEIDFVTQDIRGKYELIQVAWEITDLQTRDREEKALREAERQLGISGRIIDWQTYLSEWSDLSKIDFLI